ncbi:BREX-2 system adenine-specific DNA-methyltransferase PglX [Amycolatopsis sp. H20-H5]|uniref:BREX-2 system adenine-specific DNA-methyltransferase PglX n=1 Tax=Amycolatopsis sp. H20-H5 TaxID=3046309 RepID=UPI002DBEAE85|nr:BREX-2 system adenine-specific DNA-methyltransferase PglX [Amycolatopsis sp. H20-H5]MEC3979044.1 BREX-2 system adenine-specific DNA-methyltransferase PglX [Amycolatopsis sp. H20-H5]
MLDTARLCHDLRELVTILATDLHEQLLEDPDATARLDSEQQRLIKAGRSAASTEATRDGQIAQIAVAWVLGTVFVRFSEDNTLIDTAFIGGPRQHADADTWFQNDPQRNDRDWLIAAFDYLSDSHSSMAELFSRQHNPLWQAMPSPAAATTLLDFWRQRTVDGDYVHNLTDTTLDTRFLSTLYQELSKQESRTYALVPTPSFVADHIVDLALTPVLNEGGLRDLRIIDPACGSGTFLMSAFDHLVERWTEEAPELPAGQRVGLTLAAIHGVDLCPYAATVTRFRLLVAALHAAGYPTFKAANGADWRLSIAVGDSLLGASDDAPSTEDLGDYPLLMEPGRYDVVVGNPPYTTVKDRQLAHKYRQRYDACTGAYTLVVPFSQLYFRLARPAGESAKAGHVSLLAANSFMKRQFGRKLIEDFYTNAATLTHIIDTSGAYIPGHGTPTVILAGRNRPAAAKDPVLTVHGIQGEPAVPACPADGLVWRSIVEASRRPGYTSRWTQSLLLEQDTFWKFPWNLGGSGIAELVEMMTADNPTLNDAVARIGYFASTGSDDIFTAPPGAFHRHGTEEGPEIVEVITGSEVRDWAAIPRAEAFFPRNEQLKPVDLEKYPGHARRLWPYRTVLESRANFSGDSYLDSGRVWYDWHQVSGFPRTHPLRIVFSWVATHNHFALVRGRVAPLTSAPVIEFANKLSEEDVVQLAATLNTSAACFWLKQHSQSKGRPRVDQTGTGEPWTEIYEFTPGQLRNLPLPRRLPKWRAVELDLLTQTRDALLPERIAPTRDALASARQQWELTRAKMIAVQEELDWEVYGEYGLPDTSDLVSLDSVPPLQVGERAFEIALARRITAGETSSTWFTSHGTIPVTTVPKHWPAAYMRLVERRIMAIEQRADLNTLERPEFKRRWAAETWDKLQRNALRNWLLNRCEAPDLWFEEGQPRPRTLGQVATRLAHDPATTEAMAVYAPGTPLAEVVHSLLGSDQVPCAAALRYRDSGLRKRADWERTWIAQRAQDHAQSTGRDQHATGAHDSNPVPPKFTAADFLKVDYWRHRGKFDVHNERFISYPASHSETSFGWAGWDHAQQAAALRTLITAVENTSLSGRSELIPLLAGFNELLPWLAQWHSDDTPKWTSFLDGELERHGLSKDDLINWRPPKPRRGRPPKAE